MPSTSAKPDGGGARGPLHEARTLVDIGSQLADEGHVGAIAVRTALTLDLRASEITASVIRR